ncbi:hypothetical protein FVO59_13440 [Microbacterium esteraromaticum]|uniref:ATP/GTP-binding protein n=1 Tax=Microbacterium esteraromaticum TaxID=57043 RepID=A0A7D7WJQ0_9MICO|nr:hypothetical protein [Microbacterium esteraromaticum]QMU98090.1 hypothetical protein FVO59_13440 [Microbacterium esteraromaticum]
MPRSHRRRPERSGSDDSFGRLLAGWKRTEARRGREWTVQPVSAHQAMKEYRCPGCTGAIAPGTAHVVVWRADGVMGESADLAARRHWHTHCWRIA